MSNEPTGPEAAPSDIPEGTLRLAEALSRLAASIGLSKEDLLKMFERKEK